MIIKRVKAKNYKTYLVLDLDLSVTEERPIVLIGGANGGGKTTLFDAIYGALYGLDIRSSAKFEELLNAGALGKEDKRIELELHFSGRVLNKEQHYVLNRTYILNTDDKPVESVRLNMDGNIFIYGSATPHGQRQEAEAQVNKIIKANLPKELSRYFLFDAMEAGDLLKADQLNRVIKENIENVMGFNKYLTLARASESVLQNATAARLNAENEKREYMELVEQKKTLEQQLERTRQKYQEALQYSITNKEMVDQLRDGLNAETTIKGKIQQMESQISSIERQEALYHQTLEEFTRNFDHHICHPKLAEALKSEVSLILKTKNELIQQERKGLNPEQLERIVSLMLEYLAQQGNAVAGLTVSEITVFIRSKLDTGVDVDPFSYLEPSEVAALEQLVNSPYQNPYLTLYNQKGELNISIGQVEGNKIQIEQWKSQVAGRDYDLLKQYDANEEEITRLQLRVRELEGEVQKIERNIHKFDISTSEEPDPRYEALQRLKPFFEELANELLKAKKQQIELKMRLDLNTNLAAYKDVVDQVVFSEDLKDLTFKIFHKAGNEIYLSQLNTASKQVVIQVLLKALHEFGDYDPPVMIDTVMGVLDETSRSTVLENYFPELSHQTILLSSDSEIRPEKDFAKIEPFLSKTYTLNRDREQQRTEVVAGYFNRHINE